MLDFGLPLKSAMMIRSEILRTDDRIGRRSVRTIIPTPPMVKTDANKKSTCCNFRAIHKPNFVYESYNLRNPLSSYFHSQFTKRKIKKKSTNDTKYSKNIETLDTRHSTSQH